MKDKFVLGALLTGAMVISAAHVQAQEPVQPVTPVQVQEAVAAQPQEGAPAAAAIPVPCVSSGDTTYLVGVDDILEINVIRPESLNMTVTVSPDGAFTVPYIGQVVARDKTLPQLQEEITTRLTEGYMKYPVVNVILKESRSRRFFVYGEVVRPGAYAIDQNTSVMRAISLAGGFTKFGSSSRVKVLRVRKDGNGYEPLKINIKDVMNGNPNADIKLNTGDIVVVSEGVF